jgi:hypothetical protein
MSKHAARLRRVTTTADFQRAMREQLATQLRRNKLRRFSRTPEGSADNISGVLSCLRIETLAAESGLYQQHAAQSRGSPSGRPWSPGYPGQARARDLAPTLCRVLLMQAA